FLALLGRQISPSAFVADVAFGDFPRTFSRGNRALISGAVGRQISGRGRLLLLFLLVLQLLDELIERLDHAILLLADFGARPAQVEAAVDVVHPPRDVIEG